MVLNQSEKCNYGLGLIHNVSEIDFSVCTYVRDIILLQTSLRTDDYFLNPVESH